MIKCKYCGYDNFEGTDYCMHCSKRLDYDEFVEKNVHYNEVNSFKSDSPNFSLNNTVSDNINVDYQVKEKIILISTLSASIICGCGLFYLKRYYLGLIFLLTEVAILIISLILESYELNILFFILSLSIYFINIVVTYFEANKVKGDMYYD